MILDRDFKLFQPARTIRKFNDRFNVVTYQSRVILDTENILPFPINIGAFPITSRDFGGNEEAITKRQIITPFNAQNGYEISAEDFDPDTRREKFARLRRESITRGGEGDFDFLHTDPLAILLDAATWNFDESLRSPSYTLDEKVQAYLRTLRLVVTFPDHPYMYVSQGMDRVAGLYLHEYMPIDAPHLIGINRTLREGFLLNVPTGVDYITKITGRFSQVG